MSASHKAEVAASERLAGPDALGMRLDQWLAQAFAPDLSRARAQSLIRNGHVQVNGVPALEAKHRLRGGEQILLCQPEPEPAEPLAENIPLSILYEDDALVVIDKPPGLVVHPGAGNPTGTLVNALLFHCGSSLSGIGGVRRPGIVHRLDKDTSGVMVAAKTDRAHRALAESFADHGATGGLERAYHALVWGAPPSDRGMIDAPLGRDPRDPTHRAVVPVGRSDARRAVTHFTVLEPFPRRAEPLASLIECRLETGRTHQIRVHMAHLGHPLIGDPDYGRGFRTKANRLPEPVREDAAGFPRQALHAWLLAFQHPESGENMRFTSPPPADMENLIQAFRTLET